MFYLPKPDDVKWNRSFSRGASDRQTYDHRKENQEMARAKYKMQLAQQRSAERARLERQKRQAASNDMLAKGLEGGAIDGLNDFQRQYLMQNPEFAHKVIQDRLKSKMTSEIDPLKALKIEKLKMELAAKQGGERNSVLDQLLNAVGGLESKIGLTKSGELDAKAADAFEEATGPFDSSWVGETLGQIFHSDEVTLLRKVRQDSQAIRSLLQKALLKGGGSITENEREQVNQILGEITSARSAGQAMALVRNFKQLVNNMFSERQGAAVFDSPNPGGDPLVSPVEQEMRRRGLIK